MEIRIALVAALALAGCTPSEKSEVKSAVTMQLRDPDSARFGPMSPGKPGVICGTVNARNGFGGYAGWAPYFYVRENRRAIVGDLSGDWGDKGVVAVAFDAVGCSIGPDHQRALEVNLLLNTSEK